MESIKSIVTFSSPIQQLDYAFIEAIINLSDWMPYWNVSVYCVWQGKIKLMDLQQLVGV